MTIDGFGLSKYRKTVGREGEAFMAVLTHNRKPVAEYADYADGGMPSITILSEDRAGKIKGTLDQIHAKKEIRYHNPDTATEWLAESLIGLLDELRDCEKMFKQLSKQAGEEKSILIALYGDTWSLAPDSDGPRYVGEILGVVMNERNSDSEKTGAVRYLSQQKDVKKPCRGFILRQAGNPKAFDLSVDEYVQIFQNAELVIGREDQPKKQGKQHKGEAR